MRKIVPSQHKQEFWCRFFGRHFFSLLLTYGARKRAGPDLFSYVLPYDFSAISASELTHHRVGLVLKKFLTMPLPSLDWSLDDNTTALILFANDVLSCTKRNATRRDAHLLFMAIAGAARWWTLGAFLTNVTIKAEFYAAEEARRI